jgi:hypothetical protein
MLSVPTEQHVDFWPRAGSHSFPVNAFLFHCLCTILFLLRMTFFNTFSFSSFTDRLVMLKNHQLLLWKTSLKLLQTLNALFLISPKSQSVPYIPPQAVSIWIVTSHIHPSIVPQLFWSKSPPSLVYFSSLSLRHNWIYSAINHYWSTWPSQVSMF